MFTATTHAIAVSAEPHFLAHESEPSENRFVWAYTITIRNGAEGPVRLMARHWIITDARGMTQEVRGQGVVGQQPRLQPGESFSYTSSAALTTPSGLMYGRYQMINDKGAAFDIDIPAFPLESPAARRAAH